MSLKKINPIVSWWMTPKLPYEDVYELPLLKNKTVLAKCTHFFSHWFVHPIKRRLAKIYLVFLHKRGVKVIGITGSAGKSTTTAMLKSIFDTKGGVVITPAGIDPVFNIPNTILRCTPKTKFLILEMSVEFRGEMDYYLWLAKPDVAVITNILASHLQFFKDLDGVLAEKGKLAKSISGDGCVFLNQDDKKLSAFGKTLKVPLVWFKSGGNLLEENANAAKSVAKYFGISDSEINRGLRNFVSQEHRLELKKGKNGSEVLDDSYNSNPYAAISALKYFVKLAKNKRKVVVMGDMLQMGNFEKEGHKMVGKELSKYNFDLVIGVGKASRFTIEELKKHSPETHTELVEDYRLAYTKIKNHLKPNTFILVKGSRSIGLDKLVDMLT